MRVGAGPFHRHQDRATPFAPDAHTLNEAQHRQRDGAPDADLCIGRDKGHGKRGEAHQQQCHDQRGFASDAIAVVAENGRAYRPCYKADRIDKESLQCADDRIRLRKIQLREDQAGHRTVEEEVVPLDRGTDRAGDDGSAQLAPSVLIGEGHRPCLRGSHLASPQTRAICRIDNLRNEGFLPANSRTGWIANQVTSTRRRLRTKEPACVL